MWPLLAFPTTCVWFKLPLKFCLIVSSVLPIPAIIFQQSSWRKSWLKSNFSFYYQSKDDSISKTLSAELLLGLYNSAISKLNLFCQKNCNLYRPHSFSFLPSSIISMLSPSHLIGHNYWTYCTVFYLHRDSYCV